MKKIEFKKIGGNLLITLNDKKSMLITGMMKVKKMNRVMALVHTMVEKGDWFTVISYQKLCSYKSYKYSNHYHFQKV